MAEEVARPIAVTSGEGNLGIGWEIAGSMSCGGVAGCRMVAAEDWAGVGRWVGGLVTIVALWRGVGN